MYTGKETERAGSFVVMLVFASMASFFGSWEVLRLESPALRLPLCPAAESSSYLPLTSKTRGYFALNSKCIEAFGD